MRITTTQLRKIIRESIRKNSSLIREMAAQVTVTFEDYETGGQWTCTLPPKLVNAILIGGWGEEEQMELMEDLYTLCEEMAADEGVALGAPLSCSDPDVWAEIQKAAQYY